MRERSVNSTVLYDDGERIIVCTNYGVLLKHMLYVAVGSLLLMVTMIAATSSEQYNDPTEPSSPVFGMFIAGLIACVGAYLELRAGARLVRRNPALIVDVDGITDHCSRFLFGAGLMRWRAIVAVEQDVRTGMFSVRRSLAITLLNEPIRMLSQPPSQDLLEAGSFPFKTHMVRISQGALGIPIADFIYQFERYLDVYDSPDGQDNLSDDDEDDDDDDDDDGYDEDEDEEDEQLPDNYSTPWSS